MTIQWFPGHMAKARRQIEEKINTVDVVIELVDARAPLSSQNPMLQEIIKNKPSVTVLMKSDLADSHETGRWLTYFNKKQSDVIAINVNENKDIHSTINIVKNLGQKNMRKLRDRGIQSRPVRAMIIGIPNVGKSTLINRFVNKKVAKIGDRPGITKSQLWIKVNRDFELLDTPGILWPKFDDKLVGLRLAAIGTIKDHLLSIQDIAAFVIKYLQEQYPSSLYERYLVGQEIDDMWEIFELIGKRRGALESGGHVNFDKVANIVLRDLRIGKLGNITLELAPK